MSLNPWRGAIGLNVRLQTGKKKCELAEGVACFQPKLKINHNGKNLKPPGTCYSKHTLEDSVEAPRKLKIVLTYDPAISLPHIQRT